MHKLNHTILILGALSAATAVALGAFAAHVIEGYLVSQGYEEDLSQRLEWFDTAARYQMYHSLGLLVAGVLGTKSQPLRGPSICFLLGIVLFSGSLYAMALVSDNFRWLGAVVPFGGLSFIVGWVWLAWCAWQSQLTEG